MHGGPAAVMGSRPGGENGPSAVSPATLLWLHFYASRQAPLFPRHLHESIHFGNLTASLLLAVAKHLRPEEMMHCHSQHDNWRFLIHSNAMSSVLLRQWHSDEGVLSLSIQLQ